MEHDGNIQEIVSSIRWLIKKVQYDSSTFGREFGLTGPQGQILQLLYVKGSLSPVQLSRYLYVTPSNITGIIDRLEQKNLVTRIRQTGDRRVTLIALTKTGEKLSHKLPEILEEQLVAGLSALTPERLDLLSDSMKQLKLFIQSRNEPHSPLEKDHDFHHL